MRLQEIFQESYSSYERSHRLPYHIRKASEAIKACRTAALGGHVQECPEGHVSRQWYNSCKHRVCPQCSSIQIERWLRERERSLIACSHYHLIFTIPHDLNPLWTANVGGMGNVLFRAVRDTLFTFFSDPKYVGATPGIIASLHTWTQTLLLHPHIHCLVTDGGLGSDGWITAPRRGYLFPMRAVMAMFRGKVLAYIDKGIAKERIRLPEGWTAARWRTLRNRLGRVKWNVHVRERYDHGRGVLTYLARYLRGGPIANRRLCPSGQDDVLFRYRKGTGKGRMTLPREEFLKRFFLHVPEPRMKAVRYYGIYAPSRAEDLSVIRKRFGQTEPEESRFLDWQTYWGEVNKRSDQPDPAICPVCGLRLVSGGTCKPRARSPARRAA